MENSNSIGYFLLGVGIGTAVGMLFAPKAGAETQAYLKNKSRETADALRRQANDLSDQAAETIDRGKETVRGQVKKLSDAIDAGKQAYRDMVEEA
jgi:gas vesicle protein